MKTMLKNWMKRTSLLVIAGASLLPVSAQAHDRLDVDIRYRDRWQAPCETRSVQVWVEPVYRTVSDRVWVEPVYKTVCDNIWCPDRYEVRETTCREHGRLVIRREQVLIPGHYDRVERQVLVCEGHFNCIERRELVCEGRYETRIDRVEVPYRFHWDHDSHHGAYAHPYRD